MTVAGGGEEIEDDASLRRCARSVDDLSGWSMVAGARGEKLQKTGIDRRSPWLETRFRFVA
jgi:hypothetical protein